MNETSHSCHFSSRNVTGVLIPLVTLRHAQRLTMRVTASTLETAQTKRIFDARSPLIAMPVGATFGVVRHWTGAWISWASSSLLGLGEIECNLT